MEELHKGIRELHLCERTIATHVLLVDYR